MSRTVKMESFELNIEDLEELLPDATDEEMESIANITADALMNEWQTSLAYAVDIVKSER